MLALILLSLQIILLVYFCFFAYHIFRYSLASLKKTDLAKVAIEKQKVAVVIVTYNEKEVIFNTIKACEKLSYPYKTIIVADDSNDEKTYQKLKQLAQKRGAIALENEKYLNQGQTAVFEAPDFVLFHRFKNIGFKAGSLKELENYLSDHGYKYMYLLDSDWEPQIDALERCLEVILADHKIAYVQTKRSNCYGRWNFLQRCLALNEEGCYYVDLPGRQNTGDMILFTGCCTLFRLDYLIEAEGFQPGHLTEDIDLTNRYYLLGYKGAYREDVNNIGEVPPHYPAYRRQQDRWTAGSARTFKDYFWPILKSPILSWREKISLLRQNAYFTTSIAIELSIICAIISLYLMTANTDNYQAMLYQYYLNFIVGPYSILLVIALIANFIPLIITVAKQKKWLNIIFIPYATWLSWSLIHTYFIANIKGLLGIKQGWALTPKTGGKKTNHPLRQSLIYKFANLVTLIILIVIYWIEWQNFGTIDIYAYFWIPALTVGTLMS